ncbi:flagella cluster protein [Halobacterium sp. NMX12-1]|uniref:Flagella cluster protein n=1 Tax=Halobacterium sp. NMX12-1 TaxID=3166650 RepID=A0AAU8CA22_9EURY
MSDGLDFEAVRHRLKLLRDAGDERIFENRGDVACPVCGDAFTEALETTRRTCQLSPGPSVDVCIVREPERTIVFTHA